MAVYNHWLVPICGVAVLLCVAATFVVQLTIVAAINAKREEQGDETITGIAYLFGGIFGLKTEDLYRDYYPCGKLVWLCWIFRILAVLFLIACAWS